MSGILVAFATDDGKMMVERHFGDARFYDVYEYNGDSVVFKQRITNTTGEEERHADPKKAKGVTSLLKEAGVTVAVARQFGPNIKRIRQVFRCIVVREPAIDSAHRLVAEKIAAG